MQLYLGIDGGGTGCRAALTDADGQILARAEAGPANIASDPDTALQNILEVTHEAVKQVERGIAPASAKVIRGM